jgi:hypothetical protein
VLSIWVVRVESKLALDTTFSSLPGFSNSQAYNPSSHRQIGNLPLRLTLPAFQKIQQRRVNLVALLFVR